VQRRAVDEPGDVRQRPGQIEPRPPMAGIPRNRPGIAGERGSRGGQRDAVLACELGHLNGDRPLRAQDRDGAEQMTG
jgi:hypothetical protein